MWSFACAVALAFACKAGVRREGQRTAGRRGAAWARIVRTYGHIDDTTPLLSTSLLPEHRGRGIGTTLMDRLLDQLRTIGHRRASLSVRKANPALRLYRRAGFVDHREEGDELIMIKDLAG